MRPRILTVAPLAKLSLLLLVSEGCNLKPTRFRTNNLENPLAIADTKPVFSWAIAFSDGSYKPPRDELSINHYQSAYRIVCSDATGKDNNDNGAAVLWDSGRVLSQETLQIEYAGTPLHSLQRVQWQVQIWDEKGQECEIDSAREWPFFETGLLDEEAWEGAEWIARFISLPSNVSLCSMMAENDENQAPRFRAVFSQIPESVVQARAYIVGLGYYQLHINGEKVGDAMLDPGWTTYSKRVLYSAYDVTQLLNTTNKQHAVGVELGNGWFNPLPLLHNGHQNIRQHLVRDQGLSSSRPMFRLHIFGYTKEGSPISLMKSSAGASSDWFAAGSPTVFNNIYLGENYDARLEPAFDSWTTTSYSADANNNQWKTTVQADASGLGKLEAQQVPQIRRQKTLSSTILSHRSNDHGAEVAIIDTGVNHAGTCLIQVELEDETAKGKAVHLRYGELLTKDGDLNVMTSVVGQIKSKNPKAPCQPEVAYQQDTLTLGSRSVDWTPSWSWHGFRYIEVTLPAAVPLTNFSVECFSLRSNVDVIANLSSSDPWLSDLRGFVRNTFEANMMSVQSDCPHRERFGYGGDALGSGEAAMSIYDMAAFYRKRLLDYNDAQRISSLGSLAGFTETSPFVGIQTAGLGPGTGPIGWETFQPEAQLWLYKYYGDLKTMRDSFEHTRAYIALLDSEPKEIEMGLGDWMPVYGTDVAFTGRGFQRMSYLAFANITELLGMPDDIAIHYRQKAADIANNINKRFLLNDTGAYLVGTGERRGDVTQTGQGMALFNGFLALNHTLRAKALWQLWQDVHSSSYIKGACQGREESTPQPSCKTAEGGPGPHMTAGLFGIKWVLMALADNGLNDLAYDIVTTETYPGLRWMMKNPFANATTIWESFFFSDNVFSHSHPMFGSTEVWLLQSVVGIQPHPSARGMDHILIKPNPPSQLEHASASFESPRGIISVTWKRKADGETLGLKVIVPPNCRATIHVPATRSAKVFHHGVAISGRWVPSLTVERTGAYVVDVGSGYHEFESKPSFFMASEL
jgi:alpha-L-rhamnosidase